VCGNSEAFFVALSTLFEAQPDVPCDCEEDEEQDDAECDGGVAVHGGVALVVRERDVDCAFGHGGCGGVVICAD
jgi:hypothetical protein